MKSRRTFLTEVAGAGVAALLPAACSRTSAQQKGPPAEGAAERPRPRAPASSRSRVVRVRCAAVNARGHDVHRDKLRRMLEVGLRRLAGTDDARAALARWVRPVDTLGLKVNCLAGRQMSTHVELVEELVALLQRGGLKRSQAIVFDRSDSDLRSGGFPLRTGGSDYLSLGNDRAGYEQQVRMMPSGASRFAVMASQRASVLINLPVLKDHGIAGVTAALKNNFGLVHNPNKFHLNGCDPHVAEVNAMSFVRGKQRLVICDALRVQTEGGPAYHAAAVAAYGGLLLSTDPVALDVVAWELLEQLRAQRKLPTLTADRRRPVHLLTAGERGLGVAERARIELVDVEVS